MNPGPRGALVGRDAELSRLRGLVDPVPVESRVLIVTGDAGMGKTALLADMAQQARSAGVRVLTVTGGKSEANLPFAGLYQLLRPLLADADASGLPQAQGRALQRALGLTAEPADPDRLLTGIAVLNLLSQVSERSPVLVVVDDAQWLDRSSLDVLAFVGHRLAAERTILVFSGRWPAPPAGLDWGFPEVCLEPLPEADANRLLDAQPHPPRGRARAAALAQAAGNPLALIELARLIAADPAAGRHWAGEPLALSSRLTAMTAAQLADLPEPTKAALLIAAVADRPLPGPAAEGTSGLDVDVLVPAERLGLVRVDRSGLRFCHPFVRSAVYHAAPFTDRAAAHRRLARALADQPDRQAWHLAAASLQPDEGVASLLEATAAQAQRRGGAAAAALALERAAELSPDSEDRAKRLISAASTAIATGQADWVEDLATRALAATANPELRIAARRAAGWALAWTYIDTGRWDDALAVSAEASGLAAANHMDIVAATADVITATVLAMRAQTAAARTHAVRALARIDPAESQGVTARARHALGIAALADGSHLMAYAQLRQLFHQDGRPLHYHVSYLGVADLAAAAVRAGRQMEGLDILDRALCHVDGTPSLRLDQLTARARGLLADPASAEAHFDKALSDPAGERWPFERAQLQADYAEWLRRHRRINEAKTVMAAALETFRRLGAVSWARRAETELRACGVSLPEASTTPDVLSQLTPQQRQIVYLAGDGLTNREIGDRLFLSPRTVSSHLYRSYPKLGVAGRHQLRDVIRRAETGPAGERGAPGGPVSGEPLNSPTAPFRPPSQ